MSSVLISIYINMGIWLIVTINTLVLNLVYFVGDSSVSEDILQYPCWYAKKIMSVKNNMIISVRKLNFLNKKLFMSKHSHQQ